MMHLPTLLLLYVQLNFYWKACSCHQNLIGGMILIKGVRFRSYSFIIDFYLPFDKRINGGSGILYLFFGVKI
jgi:hypothetical protein